MKVTKKTINRDVQLENNWFVQCFDFANKSCKNSASLYSSRHATTQMKIRDDIHYGKIGEMWVSELVGGTVDFTILPPEERSYDADIVVGDENFHVKTYMSGRLHKPSWVFQKNDPVVTDPTDSDTLCLVKINLDQIIIYFVEAKGMEYSQLENKAKSKVAIYEEYLLEHLDN